MNRMVTYVFAIALGAALAGCGRDEKIPLTLAGDEGDGEFVPVDYELTSDTYKKWLVAQENLKRDAGDADLGLPAQRVLLTNPSAGSIDTVVDELESVEQTRQAIESAHSGNRRPRRVNSPSVPAATAGRDHPRHGGFARPAARDSQYP